MAVLFNKHKAAGMGFVENAQTGEISSGEAIMSAGGVLFTENHFYECK